MCLEHASSLAKGRACFLLLIERGILHLERASCSLVRFIERGMLHLKSVYFGIWLKERGILYSCTALVLLLAQAAQT